MPLLHVHRETAAIHTARDRVFGVNEEAYETDTGYSKRGNGVDSYTELDYYVDASTVLTSDELDAIQGAAAPDAGNVFATMDDVGVAGAAETAASIGNIVTGTTAKATIVDADEFGVSDSENSGDFVGILWSTIKTYMKAYIDPLVTTFTNKTISGTSNTLTVKQATALPGTHPAGELIQLDSSAATADENRVFIGDAVTANQSIELVTALTDIIPSNSQSAAYTTVLGDIRSSIDHPASDANARTFTIDSNANVPYPIGTCISFSNMAAQVVTIAITADTMYLAGTGTTGSRSLAQYGTATARKMTATTWLIAGVGLT
jgi:hypothetical protein